jgi:Fic family protein
LETKKYNDHLSFNLKLSAQLSRLGSVFCRAILKMSQFCREKPKMSRFVSGKAEICRENIGTMAKHSAQIPDLQAALARFTEGSTIAEIHSAIGERVTVRSLQRWLADLKQQGLVKTTGKGRAIRYHLSPKTAKVVTHAESIVPLSLPAKETLNYVQQPLGRRLKSGYNDKFLRGYRPNTDTYLSVAERARLLDLGQTARQKAPAGTYARQILQRLLIDLSWNSSRLEGNTYSLLDTQRLLSQGEAPNERTAAETQMILNHKDAIEFLVDEAPEIGFNRYTITNLHALLSQNLLADPAASGRLRNFPVGITSSTYLPPGLPQLIEEYFELLLEKADSIQDPFEQAFFIMVQLPYLQPFEDVNKRVSRLAANIPLNRLNLAPLSFVEVPRDLYIQGLIGVYERNRIDLLKDVFMYAYERSAARYAEVRQTLGEPNPFRLRYREDIRRVVSEIVTQLLAQQKAQEHIAAFARQLPESDRETFVEVVETELLSLHEGNFARYRIPPSQFAAWQQVWKGEKPG